MEEKKKRIYMIIIFVILLLIGVTVKLTVLNDDKDLGDEPVIEQQAENVDENTAEYEQDSDDEDTLIIKNDDYDYKVDESLNVNIREEIMQYVPKEKFVTMMKDFLSENQLMTKGTTIINDGTVNINYAAGEVTFVVIVNNSQQTSITVVVKDKTDISFLY